MTPAEYKAKIESDVAAFRQRVDGLRAERANVPRDTSPRITSSERSFQTGQFVQPPELPAQSGNN